MGGTIGNIKSKLKIFMLGPKEYIIEPKLKSIKTIPLKVKISFKKYAESNDTTNGAVKKTTYMSTKSNFCKE